MRNGTIRWTMAIASTAWCAALPSAAAISGGTDPGVAKYLLSATVYAIGALVCHQRPERSFHLWGAQLPVCARCVGVYLGAASAALVAVLTRSIALDRMLLERSRLVLALAALPTGVTLVVEWTSGQVPANWVRALAGFPLGATVMWLVVAVSTSKPPVEIH